MDITALGPEKEGKDCCVNEFAVYFYQWLPMPSKNGLQGLFPCLFPMYFKLFSDTGIQFRRANLLPFLYMNYE